MRHTGTALPTKVALQLQLRLAAQPAAGRLARQQLPQHASSCFSGTGGGQAAAAPAVVVAVAGGAAPAPCGPCGAPRAAPCCREDRRAISCCKAASVKAPRMASGAQACCFSAQAAPNAGRRGNLLARGQQLLLPPPLRCRPRMRGRWPLGSERVLLVLNLSRLDDATGPAVAYQNLGRAGYVSMRRM